MHRKIISIQNIIKKNIKNEVALADEYDPDATQKISEKNVIHWGAVVDDKEKLNNSLLLEKGFCKYGSWFYSKGLQSVISSELVRDNFVQGWKIHLDISHHDTKVVNKILTVIIDELDTLGATAYKVKDLTGLSQRTETQKGKGVAIYPVGRDFVPLGESEIKRILSALDHIIKQEGFQTENSVFDEHGIGGDKRYNGKNGSGRVGYRFGAYNSDFRIKGFRLPGFNVSDAKIYIDDRERYKDSDMPNTLSPVSMDSDTFIINPKVVSKLSVPIISWENSLKVFLGKTEEKFVEKPSLSDKDLALHFDKQYKKRFNWSRFSVKTGVGSKGRNLENMFKVSYGKNKHWISKFADYEMLGANYSFVVWVKELIITEKTRDLGMAVVANDPVRFLIDTGHKKTAKKLKDALESYDWSELYSIAKKYFTVNGSLFTAIKSLEKGFLLTDAPADLKEKSVDALKDVMKKIHSKGIFHRDVKPGNVWVNLDNDKVVVSLIDFESAVIEEESQYTTPLMTATPGYSSPLQLIELPNTFKTDFTQFFRSSDDFALKATEFWVKKGVKPFSPEQWSSFGYLQKNELNVLDQATIFDDAVNYFNNDLN